MVPDLLMVVLVGAALCAMCAAGTGLTAPRNTVSTQKVDRLRLPMAEGAVIFVGSLVCTNSDGYAIPAADASGNVFKGLCVDDPQSPGISQFDNSNGDDGDMYVVVQKIGYVRMTLGSRSPSQDMLGALVYVVDDHTVAVQRFDVSYQVICGAIVHLPTEYLAQSPRAQFDADEVEFEMQAEAFEWGSKITTAAPTTAGT